MSQVNEAFEVLLSGADRTAWLIARLGGVGASEGPTVLNSSPYESVAKLWYDKVNEVVEEVEDPNFEWGHRLEPEILRKFADDSGLHVEPTKELLRSTRWPWMLATIDGRSWEDEDQPVLNPDGWIHVEAKATTSRKHWGSGLLPMHVWMQVQHQLAVVGRTYGYVSVLTTFDGWGWASFKVDRDDRFIEHDLVPKCKQFMLDVESGKKPGADGHPGTGKALNQIHGYKDNSIKLEGGKWPNRVVSRKVEEGNIARAEDAKREVENQFRVALGENSEALLDTGERVTNRRDKNGSRRLRFYAAKPEGE